MPEWFAAACILILVVLLWPVKQCFGFRTATVAMLSRFGLCASSRQMSDPDRRGSEPATAAGAGETVSLICKPSTLANYLLKHCVTFSNFTTGLTWSWRRNPFLQTVFNACWPVERRVHFIRDYLQMSDDGLVALDWAVAGSAFHKRRRASSNSTNPVLLVIPNSFGKITRNVLKLCEGALNHGYLPVVFNRRSHNGSPLSTAKLQQFGDPADLREAVRYIRYRQPSGRLYAVSESTGSGLLLSYLGECGSSSYVTAAACLSPIFRCQDWFETGAPWLYRWALLLYQKICLSRYKTALGETLCTDALFSSSSLQGLEEALFCQGGQKGAVVSGGSWDSYWERNDPLRDVDEVAIPVLCLCSQDDQVRGDPRTTLPFELFESNPHFFLLLTEQGGHCGFATAGNRAGGADDAPLWSHQALLEFFRATSEFFAAEERTKLAARRRGLGGGTNVKAFRGRGVSICKREAVCSHNIPDIYNWQRSYTR
ncbi:protein ABHD15-like [Acipenser ruthenus]|uniref:protein ABHD15-like n=1 Tax=Acipenser ruthenus TaxID=7906 RepID=UPI00145C14B0|nr:protein ABHD15-like [Acipenser ruthenus]XP_058857251.1 protein ABHD15-like [Acipenser ruthenus]XP_058857252.1 protein ABHD15-like [Acipenser ruthenus]